MAIHGKQFGKAAQILQQSGNLFKGSTLDSVMELKARLLFVQQNLAAVPYYSDSIQTAMPLPERMYAIASLYAFTGDSTKALHYLSQALDKGFSYKYLLDNDPVWKTVRGKDTWNTMLKDRSFKTYPVTEVPPGNQ
jgi:hypothetical protein